MLTLGSKSHAYFQENKFVLSGSEIDNFRTCFILNFWMLNYMLKVNHKRPHWTSSWVFWISTNTHIEVSYEWLAIVLTSIKDNFITNVFVAS